MSPSRPILRSKVKGTDPVNSQRLHIQLSVGSPVNKYPGKSVIAKRICSNIRNLLFSFNCCNSVTHYRLAKQHARRVASHLGLSKGLVYLVGKPTVFLDDSDQTIPFRQRRYFYYLSGVDEPDCYLTYDIAKDHLTLYVPDFDLRQTIWMGPTLSIGEALER